MEQIGAMKPMVSTDRKLALRGMWLLLALGPTIGLCLAVGAGRQAIDEARGHLEEACQRHAMQLTEDVRHRVRLSLTANMIVLRALTDTDRKMPEVTHLVRAEQMRLIVVCSLIGLALTSVLAVPLYRWKVATPQSTT